MFYGIVTRGLLTLVFLIGATALGMPVLAQHGGHGGSHHYGGHHHGGPWYGGYGHHYYPSYYRGCYGARYGTYSSASWPYSDTPRVYSYPGSPAPYADQQSDGTVNSYRTTSTTTGGANYLQSAESAFHIHHYEDAIGWAKRAARESPREGRLFLLLSQIHLAVGEYGDAAGAARLGMSLLPQEEWGNVVKNFRSYYHDSDYVAQIRRLERFIAENPNHANSHFLLGYHWTFLGHSAAANCELTKAEELDPRDDWANRLLQLNDISGPIPQPPPTESVRGDRRPAEPIAKNEAPQSVHASVEYAPPQQFDKPLKSNAPGAADHKHDKGSK